MTTLEKIAYLKGIIAASNISDTQTKRIYEAMLDVLDSIAEDVEFNADNIDNIDSRLSEVDEDLDAVESLVFGDELFEDYAEDEDEGDDDDDDFIDEYDADDFDDYEDEAEDDDDFMDDADDAEAAHIPLVTPAAADDSLTAEDDADDEEDDDDFEDDDEEDGEEMYEIECPACHETIYLQESVILEGAVDCPNCGEPLEFDIEFEEE